MKRVNSKRQRKNMVICIMLIVIVIVGIGILGGKDNNLDEITEVNYLQEENGNKVNTSTDVAEDKVVDGVILSKSKIVYENGMSKLTSKVANNSESKDNLRFKVKFIANDGAVIAESVGYIGPIKENQTKYIDSYITNDVVNAKDIVYEIMS